MSNLAIAEEVSKLLRELNACTDAIKKLIKPRSISMMFVENPNTVVNNRQALDVLEPVESAAKTVLSQLLPNENTNESTLPAKQFVMQKEFIKSLSLGNDAGPTFSPSS